MIDTFTSPEILSPLKNDLMPDASSFLADPPAAETAGEPAEDSAGRQTCPLSSPWGEDQVRQHTAVGQSTKQANK